MRCGSCTFLLAPLAIALISIATPAAAAPDLPAACPSVPVRVLRSNGPATEHSGIYQGIPDLCYQIRGTIPGYFYYGVWNTEWPGAGDAYPAIKTAMNGAKGVRTQFITRSLPGWQWIDSFVNEGIEPMTVGDRSYMVLRLAHEREGIEGNTYHSIITSWRDVTTGVTLKTVETQISGKSYGPDTTWQAVGVEPLR